MANLQNGQVDWDDNVSTSDFLKLEQGDNQVRLFTKPFRFEVHWIKDGSGVNRKLKCALENCPLCKKGIRAQPRWLVGVIDRRSGKPKLLEITHQIFLGIRSYNGNSKWGDVNNYDVVIQRGPKGTQPLYSVLGIPEKGMLTPEEKVQVEGFLTRVDITKFIQPAKQEDLAEQLGTSFSGVQYAVGNKVVSNPGGGAKPQISESDFNFGEDDI